MTEDAEQMKIRGLKIIVTRKNIKIIDAYQINNTEKMEMILKFFHLQILIILQWKIQKEL